MNINFILVHSRHIGTFQARWGEEPKFIPCYQASNLIRFAQVYRHIVYPNFHYSSTIHLTPFHPTKHLHSVKPMVGRPTIQKVDRTSVLPQKPYKKEGRKIRTSSETWKEFLCRFPNRADMGVIIAYYFKSQSRTMDIVNPRKCDVHTRSWKWKVVWVLAAPFLTTWFMNAKKKIKNW